MIITKTIMNSLIKMQSIVKMSITSYSWIVNRSDHIPTQQHYQYQIFEFAQLPVDGGFPQFGSDVVQKRHLHSHPEKGQSTIRRNGQ